MTLGRNNHVRSHSYISSKKKHKMTFDCQAILMSINGRNGQRARRLVAAVSPIAVNVVLATMILYGIFISYGVMIR